MSPNRASRDVAIVAAGIISPLGRDCAETIASLRAGHDAVSPVTSFDVSKCRSSTAGQIQDEWLDCFVRTRRQKRLHRASKMMIAAAEELAGQDRDFAPELIVIGTTSGGMTFGESFFRSLIRRENRPERAGWLANYNPQKPVLDAMEAAGFSAPSQIIANACASGTNAIGHAFSLVRSGECDRVLCGGYDAISEMVFVGFDSLQASTSEKIRPFDKARTGLVLGEGAALLALEAFDQAVSRGATILGRVTGYGISTDNFHLTQPHPSGIGPQLAMERALASAGRNAAEVDYINAHGTATAFNDATEGAAIARLFNETKTPVSSTKSMMGHSLGAAGAIEAVISLLALREQFLPPNINFCECDPAFDLNIVANAAREAEMHCALSNSFGFGGTNATIVLETVHRMN
ncbi:MAG: 3-oxoacyl-[acyl-carrier-protein] synthase [Chthoniobacter sp.]|jgi:3-oxoacyl-[acyl-carrier-protein] synthase II|nr:3-oxoacyl-[acyl-carrier-protein] synthase [Chthoniobacter sp.]